MEHSHPIPGERLDICPGCTGPRTPCCDRLAALNRKKRALDRGRRKRRVLEIIEKGRKAVANASREP